MKSPVGLNKTSHVVFCMFFAAFSALTNTKATTSISSLHYPDRLCLFIVSMQLKNNLKSVKFLSKTLNDYCEDVN